MNLISHFHLLKFDASLKFLVAGGDRSALFRLKVGIFEKSLD